MIHEVIDLDMVQISGSCIAREVFNVEDYNTLLSEGDPARIRTMIHYLYGIVMVF